MKCPNCGNTNENQNNKFCTYCGTKLDNNEQNLIKEQPQNNPINQNTVNNNQNINSNVQNNNNTTTFLIIGIIMAMCCSMPFGAGVILLNELKYKKELQNGQLDATKKTKTIMIVLIVVGILLGILATGLQFIGAFIEGFAEGLQSA